MPRRLYLFGGFIDNHDILGIHRGHEIVDPKLNQPGELSSALVEGGLIFESAIDYE